MAGLPTILTKLTADLKSVYDSLSSINIGNATADVVTPLTNEVKSLLSAAVSEVSALACSPLSTILSSKGCECSGTSSHGVLSVPDVVQLLAPVLSLVTGALGDVLAVVDSTPAADIISPLLCNATYVMSARIFWEASP
ncbi:hypothetical protein C8R44DRAFT_876521 [Mycena epipterygia]|nr:hypothetical protein C8R44DRAFT_876521 [Mycena epipterygia]